MRARNRTAGEGRATVWITTVPLPSPTQAGPQIDCSLPSFDCVGRF
jgi:hypothetical protein